MPVDRGPGAARERMANPRAGTAPRFRLSGLPFRKGALNERVEEHVTEVGTIVKRARLVYSDAIGLGRPFVIGSLTRSASLSD